MVALCSDRFPFADVADRGQRSHYAADALEVSLCHAKADGLGLDDRAAPAAKYPEKAKGIRYALPLQVCRPIRPNGR